MDPKVLDKTREVVVELLQEVVEEQLFLFTRLESLAWSQQGPDSQVSAENIIYETFVVV